MTDGTTYMPPEVEPVNTSDGPICPVPEGIRPVMKKHRIEVSGSTTFVLKVKSSFFPPELTMIEQALCILTET